MLKNVFLKYVLYFILVATTTLPAKAQLSEHVQDMDKGKSPDSLTEVVEQKKTRFAVIRTAENIVKSVSVLSHSRVRDLPKTVTTKIIKAGILTGRRIYHPKMKEHFRSAFGLMIQLLGK